MAAITQQDINSLIQLLSINAFQYKLENMDLTLKIEQQVTVVKEQPEGRCFNVGAELPKFQKDFIDKLYADVIKSQIFQEFSSDEEKLQFAHNPEEWNRIADVSDLDFSGAYEGKCGSYILKYSGYILDLKNFEPKMTESSQEAVFMAGIFLKELEGYFSSAKNDLSAWATLTYSSVDRYLPKILEIKEKGLTTPLYSYVVEQLANYFLSYPFLTLKALNNPALKAGFCDAETVNKVLAAAEKLNSLPDLDNSAKSVIENAIGGIKSLDERENGSTRSGCMSVILVLLMIVPAISFGIAKLLA